MKLTKPNLSYPGHKKQEEIKIKNKENSDENR